MRFGYFRLSTLQPSTILPVMTDARVGVIKSNPIGEGLNTFRDSFNFVCDNSGVSRTRDALEQLCHEGEKASADLPNMAVDYFADLQNIVRVFLRAAQNLPAADLLSAKTSPGTLRDDLLRLEFSLRADEFDFDRIKPLLNAALADHIDDALVWDQVYNAVTESTPLPPPDRILRSTNCSARQVCGTGRAALSTQIR
ncbi:hypothetical protein V8F33_003475, partial [Rhypophila sp. PSN 637]